jgi:tetratricopeptide (TPR) repeat protein
MKLSLAMIVKNEADNLGRCLESAKGLADEMIVVDTGSTDRTIEIAKANGARVGQFVWTGSFAEARNYSLSLCTGDWILVLDGDEMLNPAEHPIIREAIQNQDAIGYRLWHKHYLQSGSTFGTGGTAKPNEETFGPASLFSHCITPTILRLFRNQDSPAFTGRVHEEMDPWFEKHGFQVKYLDATIHHFGKIDPDRELAKQPMYLDLAKKDRAENPDDPLSHFNVLQGALMLKEWPTVIESAREIIRLKGDAPSFAHLAGAKALIALGEPEEALAFIQPIEAREDFSPAILTVKAEAHNELGNLQEAVDASVAAIDADPYFTASYIRLSNILDAAGDTESARKVLEAGLDQNTQDQTLWEALVGLSAKHKDPRVSQDAWYAIQAVPNGGQGVWHLLVANILYGQGDAEDALTVLDMGLKAFPGNLEIMGTRRKFTGK